MFGNHHKGVGQREEFETSGGLAITLPYTLISCRNADGEMLMVRRMKPPFIGKLNFVGGKIEPGESALSSAQRELGEEVGIRRRQSLFRYKGIAIWPDRRLNTAFVGMHLFAIHLGAKSKGMNQLSILDEGIFSWFPIKALVEDMGCEVVPNFSILFPVLVDRIRRPRVVAHTQRETGSYDSTIAPLRIAQEPLQTRREGRITLGLNELVQKNTDFDRIMAMLEDW